nr:hypothetical protein [Tanacetum cinerariifolium]
VCDMIHASALDFVLLESQISAILAAIEVEIEHSLDGGGLVNLSHMFYTDDAVFVGQWCDSNITTLVHVLGCFHKAFGLRCLVLKTLFSYLGSIVGGYMSRKQTWNDILERVNKRLSKWKMQTLSLGGRLMLVKSVLGSMPIFNFSIFKSSMGVLRELEGILSYFINGHDSKSKKATWVNWKKVLLSKDRGNTLWARVIKAIHGADGRIGANSSVGISSCWTTITQEMNSLSKKGIDLMKYMYIKVGNVDTTVFWEDKWCEEGVLKDRRNPRGGCKLDQFKKVEELVRLVSLAPISDRWIWEWENTRDFSVASVRRMIDDKMLSMLDCKTRWIKYMPIKINVHAWKVMTDSLPTRTTSPAPQRHAKASYGTIFTIITVLYVCGCDGPTMSLGNVAQESYPGELFPSTYPGRHIAQDCYPQRQVAQEGLDLSLGIVVNVVVSI